MKHSLSLRVRTALAIGSMVVAIAFVFGMLVENSAGNRIEAEITASLGEIAHQMRDKLDRGMFERYRDIRIATALHDIAGDSLSVEEGRALLDRMKATYPSYAWIGFANADGIVSYSTGSLLEGESVAARPWFRDALSGPFVGDVHEAKLLAKLLPAEGGRPLRFVDVAAPIHRNGVFLGVLGAHLSWSWAEEVRNSVLRPEMERRGIEILVLDTSGTVLLGPDSLSGEVLPLPASDQDSGFLIEPWADGRRYAVGFSRTDRHLDYPGLGWTVLVRQPLDVAFQPVAALTQRIMVWGAALCVLFVALSWPIAGWLTAPLARIRDTADRLTRHDDGSAIPEATEYPEALSLSRSLNHLLKRVREDEKALAAARDTLEQRVAERSRELVVANDTLRAEIEERRFAQKQLADAVAHLEVLNNTKNRFFSIVAHDLRSPFTGILGGLELLADGASSLTSAEIADYARLSLGEARAVHALLENLLRWARLQMGQIRAEPRDLDLASQIGHAIRVLRPAALAKSIAIEIEVPPVAVEADPDMLDAILRNLVGNAVKFTPQGGRVIVSASAEGEKVVLSVTDTGIGMEPEVLERLFRLDQHHSTPGTAGEKGTGLGLLLCQEMAQLNGGRIEAGSTPGQGSTFRVHLRAGRTAARPARKDGRASAA
jgi:two-component system, sensor histidine kinase